MAANTSDEGEDVAFLLPNEQITMFRLVRETHFIISNVPTQFVCIVNTGKDESFIEVVLVVVIVVIHPPRILLCFGYTHEHGKHLCLGVKKATT